MQGFYSSPLAIDSAVCITFSRRLKGQGSAHGAEHDMWVETETAKLQSSKSRSSEHQDSVTECLR